MTTGKTTTLTFRIEPGLKDALRAAAEQEHRSIANMIEVMIRDYCGRVNVKVSAATEVRGTTAKTRRSRIKKI